MTESDTEYNRFANTPQGAIRLAAADATSKVWRILRRLGTVTGRKQNQIADILDVTEGRVSQVLNGDGNLTVAALAKYARAYGYSVDFVLTPVEPGVPELPREQVRRRRSSASVPGPTQTVTVHYAGNWAAHANQFTIVALNYGDLTEPRQSKNTSAVPAKIRRTR
ncbi:helix-turn-helix domain-containing protein [Nocardia sp. alder85J]|uniref:helix-turn-helix domain-containing protein n=1 Tax=Nocardia sp. alder85J TaxID=2862949 RepID=UPI001CD4863F|nr:helix-turn-helix transcriptional regulator [Nocardia sp. alder85J]MCX4098700.1 helix-turn-helix transcriptional regulator [Nocardia sp. alder85J]